MAAVYGTAKIAIVGNPGMTTDPRAIEVVDDAYDGDTPPGTALRRKIVDAVIAKCSSAGLRMCVVFAADDCVFIEPDGSTSRSSVPPSGGLRMDRVKSSRGRR